MADISVQRRAGKNWLWGLLGLIALGLVVWILSGNQDDTQVTMEPVAEVIAADPMASEVPDAVGVTEAIPISDIAGSPATWVGRTLDGNVRVLVPATDRGFWVEEDGKQLFALVIGEPLLGSAAVRSGQTLRVQQAIIQDPTYLAQVHGETIDENTRRIAGEQTVFLVVDGSNVTPMN